MSSLNKMHNEAQNPRLARMAPRRLVGQVTASGLPWRGREGRQGRGGEEDLQPLPDFTLPRPPRQDHQDHEVWAEEGGD